MAKRKVNKAAKIREYLSEHGLDTSPKDVMADLKAKRINVSPAQVSNVKTSMRGGKPASKPGRPAKRGSAVDLDALMEANRFVKQAGGIESAKRALDTLAKLQ